MNYLADHPDIVHAAVLCLVFALGLAALALVTKFAEWYDERRRYADGMEDRMDLEENVERLREKDRRS